MARRLHLHGGTGNDGTLAPEMEILVKDGAPLLGQWVAGDFIL